MPRTGSVGQERECAAGVGVWVLAFVISKCQGQAVLLASFYVCVESLKDVPNNSKCLFSTCSIPDTVPGALSVVTSLVSQQSCELYTISSILQRQRSQGKGRLHNLPDVTPPESGKSALQSQQLDSSTHTRTLANTLLPVSRTLQLQSWELRLGSSETHKIRCLELNCNISNDSNNCIQILCSTVGDCLNKQC